MVSRVVGADSAALITEELVTAAVRVFGVTPAFWGRYFTNTTTQGNVEYRHRIENRVLNTHGIRVLPIARQTNHVGGMFVDGKRDGYGNFSVLAQTFSEDHLESPLRDP